MPKTYVSVSGSTVPVLNIQANIGGTQRAIQQGWVGDSGGVSRLFFLFGDILTLIVGAETSGTAFEYGYSNLASDHIGSLSPTTLGDGRTVTTITDSGNGFGAGQPITRTISITGFSSDPGIGYINKLTLNSVGLTGSSASYFFGFNSVSNKFVASWAWTISQSQVITPGASYQVTIQRS